MSKIKILTAVVLAAGIGAITKAFSEHPEEAAADVLALDEARESAEAVAEQALEAVEKNTTTSSDAGPSFKLDETTYGFHFKAMIHGGKRITAEDVVGSEELQQELVKLGSGMIYPKA